MSLAALVAGSPLLAAQRDPRTLGDHRRIPGFAEMTSVFDFEPVFHGNVPQTVYDYTAHGADSEATIRRNRDAFGWVDVVPRAPVDATAVDTRTTVLGLSLEFPLFVAPTALQVALHPDGDVGMHRAATATKTPFIISNNSSQPAEKIATSSSGPAWFQFYPRRSLDESRALLERVQGAGCQAIVVTVDQQATFYERKLHLRNLGGSPRTAAAPRRPGAPRNPYRVSEGRLVVRVALPRPDPAVHQRADAGEGHPAPPRTRCSASNTVRRVSSSRTTAADRSTTGRRRSKYCLRSSTRSGARAGARRQRIPPRRDVMKALALGANAVCLGRATRWGLGPTASRARSG